MDGSKQTEDDTLRGQSESGYEDTRPRFTRARRGWKLNVRNLIAEDARALDAFALSQNLACRGANAFLYPNLLANGSFEVPAYLAAEFAAGWVTGQIDAEAQVALSTATAFDGFTAALFSTVAATSIPPAGQVTAALQSSAVVPCLAGEVYVFAASVNTAAGTLAGAATRADCVTINFTDADGNPLSALTSPAAALGGGWQPFSYQFTVPAGAVSMQVSLIFQLGNPTGGAIALDGSESAAWDSVGLALLTGLTPYGRMAGSASLGTFVRFSVVPEISDIGYGGGVKRYGAHFELKEK